MVKGYVKKRVAAWVLVKLLNNLLLPRDELKKLFFIMGLSFEHSKGYSGLRFPI